MLVVYVFFNSRINEDSLARLYSNDINDAVGKLRESLKMTRMVSWSLAALVVCLTCDRYAPSKTVLRPSELHQRFI